MKSHYKHKEPKQFNEYNQSKVHYNVSAEEKERVRRLQAQEESLSSPIGGAARKGGRVTGLTQG